jgi:uncharacterized protein YhfF
MMTIDDMVEFEQMLETLARTEGELDDLIDRMRRKHDTRRVHELRTAAMQLGNVKRYIETARD